MQALCQCKDLEFRQKLDYEQEISVEFSSVRANADIIYHTKGEVKLLKA